MGVIQSAMSAGCGRADVATAWDILMEQLWLRIGCFISKNERPRLGSHRTKGANRHKATKLQCAAHGDEIRRMPAL